jgi:hypothetical protein
VLSQQQELKVAERIQLQTKEIVEVLQLQTQWPCNATQLTVTFVE